ncbi:hypothetical protein F3Y22_tig00110299pilonHSYRG00063 [Hibiscus syriacus]|uniref:Uncharacterized protein n=1 Tax=Hibiscus syriacus TaxID=106335 RepID=A0A6A3B7L1_HIBSY|nr:hypothetical protein F3Y22_tig00110299pilonHSYRG00063 [Hibiscus syriacus]
MDLLPKPEEGATPKVVEFLGADGRWEKSLDESLVSGIGSLGIPEATLPPPSSSSTFRADLRSCLGCGREEKREENLGGGTEGSLIVGGRVICWGKSTSEEVELASKDFIAVVPERTNSKRVYQIRGRWIV